MIKIQKTKNKIVYFCLHLVNNLLMLQLSFIRENPEYVKKKLKVRHFKDLNLIDNLLDLDKNRRSKQKELDNLLAQININSQVISQLVKQNQLDKIQLIREQTQLLKERTKILEKEIQELDNEIHNLLVVIPNLPHEDVIEGKSSDDNQIIYQSENVDENNNIALPHWEIAEKLKLIDFEKGSKISGSGFPVYIGLMAKLQRSLIQFFIEQAIEAGYKEIQIPYLVNESSVWGTGQLPDKDKQMYYIQEDNLYLIPTAEVPLTNLYAKQILKESELPIKLVGYSACFRREAGSYGKEVRGLNRIHQFDKVEIVRIEKPENSYYALEEMCNHVSKLLNLLELPYRIVRLCGADLGFASAMTYDFEVWAAGQKRWLEVSSVSNFETFQSVRMNLRYKDDKNKIHYLHTLNGSALALPRLIAALLENFQTPEGIKIPSVLHPYTKFTLLC